MAAGEPLAIVGVGCRFPGSHGREGLWRTLLEARDEVAANPGYRARTRAGMDPPSHPGTRRRGSIGDVESFDWRAFRMSPRESKYVDPQQRLLLEAAWEAFEDAGLPFEQVAGSRTGVFMGLMWPDWAKLLAENPTQLAAYATSGVGFALAANRISYVFDLRGPSVSLDVQCASSLVAVRLAAASIWSGDADLALAGGVNLILTADSDLMMSRAGILSPSGSCRTFDASADGFVRSEGVGVIVLKPLSRALADEDRVLAAIRGAAYNHDGRRAPLTAPSRESQIELVRLACADAGIEGDELDYVELHGTGTQKGDPIEASALGEAMGPRAPDDPCLVGSIKTNIGHCESAAGVASVIKVALALYHGIIPPTVNSRDPNPAIDGGALGIELVTEKRRWPPRGRPLLAGVTGLSLGGGNAHVVLEQVSASRPLGQSPSLACTGPLVLPLSARSESSLRRLVPAYAAHLEEIEGDRAALFATCAAAALRRTHHEHRIAVTGETAAELAAALRRLLEGTPGSPATPPPEPGSQGSPQELAALQYRTGCDVQWTSFYGTNCAAVALPTYRWSRERLWIDPEPEGDLADVSAEPQNARK